MPVQILTARQVAQYGHFVGEPSQLQLVNYFHLDDRDRIHIQSFYSDHTRLGFAVQLGTVRFLDVFPTDINEIPPTVVTHIARQLNINAGELTHYGKRSQRWHKQINCQRYGYQHFLQSPLPFTLIRQINSLAWLTQEK